MKFTITEGDVLNNGDWEIIQKGYVEWDHEGHRIGMNFNLYGDYDAQKTCRWNDHTFDECFIDGELVAASDSTHKQACETLGGKLYLEPLVEAIFTHFADRWAGSSGQSGRKHRTERSKGYETVKDRSAGVL